MSVPSYIVKTFKKLGRLSTFVQFQSELLACVENTEEFLQTFRHLETNIARVNFLYEKLQLYNLLEDKFTEDAKNDRKANKHKEKANKLFSTGKYNQALQYYTRSIMKAESSEMLAMAYANRSAALYKLNLREESLMDLERALAHNYPDHLKPSLLSRREKLTGATTSTRQISFYEPPPEITSDCIAIREDSKSKLRVFATRDIHVGDVIAVEKPFTFTVAASELYHCHHCFELCYNPLPCLSCSQALYCSDLCRDNANATYHKYECPILITLKNIVGKHKAFLLSVKMAFQSGETPAEEVMRLVNNMDAEDVQDEIFTTALVTALMYHFVKTKTDRFDGENEEVEDKFKDLLMIYMRVSLVHAAGIDELRPVEVQEGGLGQELLRFKSETVGCALYPFYGLFRHQCCPNVFAHHHGVNRVLRAVRTIQEGAECFVSYGPYYVEHGKQERRERLRSQYHFTCTCTACKENWPQLDLNPYYITERDDLVFVSEIRDLNVQVARNSVFKYINKVQELEETEPSSELTLQQKLLSYCYDVIGNKRVIL